MMNKIKVWSMHQRLAKKIDPESLI